MSEDQVQTLQKPPRWWRRRWARWLLEFAVIVVILLAVRAYTSRDLPEGKAPVFSGQLLSGEAFDLRQLRGKPAIVHFWATWCSICRLEQDSIEALSQDYPVITIAMQSGGADAVGAYLDKHGLSFPVYIDEDSALAERYGVSGVPTTFVLGADGQIEFAEVGYTTGWGLRARLWFAQ
jgi:thiol-disulfide isomerase/thioredoxin